MPKTLSLPKISIFFFSKTVIVILILNARVNAFSMHKKTKLCPVSSLLNKKKVHWIREINNGTARQLGDINFALNLSSACCGCLLEWGVLRILAKRITKNEKTISSKGYWLLMK